MSHGVHDTRLGVMRWLRSRVSNGLLEGLNSLIQAPNAKPAAWARHTNNDLHWQG